MSARAVHLGVDLGTSRTAAAIAVTAGDAVSVRPVRLGRAGTAASSSVFAADDGLVHGDQAERLGVAAPERLLRETRRRVGDPVPLVAAGRALPAAQLYAATVGWVVDAVAAREDAVVDEVTVTVPSAWSAHRLGTVADALATAGLPRVTLLSEPLAAAAHARSMGTLPDGAVVAVYDLGETCFEFTLLRYDGDADLTVIHSAIIGDLGGADFDDLVLQHVRDAAGTAISGDPSAVSALRRACVRAKEDLAASAETEIALPRSDRSIRLVRSEFEAMVAPLLERTVALCGEVLREAGLDREDVAAIVLAGGSSRMPAVAQQLSDAFDRPLLVDPAPHTVIARGAARAGAAASLRAEAGAGLILGRSGAAETAMAPTPLIDAETEASAARGRHGVLDLPARWRAAMVTTAACALLVGGFAVGGAITAAPPAPFPSPAAPVAD